MSFPSLKTDQAESFSLTLLSDISQFTVWCAQEPSFSGEHWFISKIVNGQQLIKKKQ